MSAGPSLLAVLVAATLAAAATLRSGERAAVARWRASSGEVSSRSPSTPAWFAHLVVRAELDVAPASAWPVARAVAAVTAMAAASTSPAAASAVIVLVVATIVAEPAVVRHRASGAYQGELLAAVEALSAELGSGSSLAGAVAAATRPGTAMGVDLQRITERHLRGERLQEGLDAWGRSRPGTGAGLVADALALAGASGAGQARALSGVARTLRERAAVDREVRALSAQARASAAVLVGTPVAFAAAVALLEPRVGAFLVTTPPGWVCLLLGAGLDGIGAWWMARLLRGLT